MAGNWIKFEHCTFQKTEVWQLSQKFKIEVDAVIGKLLRVWCWFDQHSEDGHAHIATKALLDRDVGVTGFCDALICTGWLHTKGEHLCISNFDRHNGETAKNRVLARERQRRARANTVTEKSRVDKIREDSKNNSAFAHFWESYPKKKNKFRAEKSFNGLTQKEKEKATEDCKTRFADTTYQFIPYPSTYLNNKSWNDEEKGNDERPHYQTL